MLTVVVWNRVTLKVPRKSRAGTVPPFGFLLMGNDEDCGRLRQVLEIRESHGNYGNKHVFFFRNDLKFQFDPTCKLTEGNHPRGEIQARAALRGPSWTAARS